MTSQSMESLSMTTEEPRSTTSESEYDTVSLTSESCVEQFSSSLVHGLQQLDYLECVEMISKRLRDVGEKLDAGERQMRLAVNNIRWNLGWYLLTGLLVLVFF